MPTNLQLLVTQFLSRPDIKKARKRLRQRDQRARAREVIRAVSELMYFANAFEARV
jgi:hypothetical protein